MPKSKELQEKELKEKLEYPLKDGKLVEKSKACFCIVDGKVCKGTVLGYIDLERSVPYDDTQDYDFTIPAHRVRLKGGEEVESTAVFPTKKEAEELLERGKPTIYRIKRTSPDPFETP